MHLFCFYFTVYAPFPGCCWHPSRKPPPPSQFTVCTSPFARLRFTIKLGKIEISTFFWPTDWGKALFCSTQRVLRDIKMPRDKQWLPIVSWQCSTHDYQKSPHVRNSSARNSGAGNGHANFMGSGNFWFFVPFWGGVWAFLEGGEVGVPISFLRARGLFWDCPRPKVSLKMPPRLPLPPLRLSQNSPRGEANCAAKNCLAALRYLSGPSENAQWKC